ncbi:hypothetical protein HNO92_003633 [Chromobacterium alkanivorans]|uniref:DUF3261 domain-containing protein n=1 Tax=Chromobacterium alkanivorans TaxID=1071719 RepID=UPI00216A1C57|nr:DUF3261 domain-containing protein [Chromobacterium alkanivorans]MCS3806059.1 hypothetical protein [Chromobacterium alkanivorans]MCS3820539.1 hypothetical protein [Chromobacterium alkanivorans]MCS3875297.1 hypothetical protein [Chromobacterium alkanivorans]
MLKLLPLLLLLTACAGGGHCVRLPQTPAYCLRPPAETYGASQLVTASGRGFRELSLLQLEADGQRLSLAALSPLGQPLLSAGWDGRRWSASSPFGRRVSEQGPAMLALAQWLHLPEAAVLDGFGRAPAWWLHAADGQRRLMNGDQTLLIDAPTSKGRRVQLPQLGMTLEIESLAAITPDAEPQ